MSVKSDYFEKKQEILSPENPPAQTLDNPDFPCYNGKQIHPPEEPIWD